jgi:hypothetical protein
VLPISFNLSTTLVHNKQPCTPHTAFAYEFCFPLISLEIQGIYKLRYPIKKNDVMLTVTMLSLAMPMSSLLILSYSIKKIYYHDLLFYLKNHSPS